MSEQQTQQLPLRVQLTRFVLTGGLSAVVDFGLLLVGQYLLGMNYSVAKAISWVFGTITAYAINRRWTFQSDGGKRTFAAVVVLYLLTFALQVGTYSVCFPALSSMMSGGLATTGAFVIAQGLATTVNFIVQRTLIFKQR